MADRVPGLSAAVVRTDGVRWLPGLGVANLAEQVPATPQAIFLWFSMTKIVTATLRLADGEQLSLGDPVVRHYPQFASLRPGERAARVTVRHLLGHSAGLANRRLPGQDRTTLEGYRTWLLGFLGSSDLSRGPGWAVAGRRDRPSDRARRTRPGEGVGADRPYGVSPRPPSGKAGSFSVHTRARPS